jgi:hypothetical protein
LCSTFVFKSNWQNYSTVGTVKSCARVVLRVSKDPKDDLRPDARYHRRLRPGIV